ncbi:hypothetical protein COEREDRAFT_87215 [Coemansia reversa NRRL 1564]|uniref:Transferase n=1 Tax=Coemansia reversa (strain ATCC 12441 / NRRL 1564) TaxID=763665 RepID=A0A2G5BB64_COERN|nr:hypothetical protein COEREDRAFT_87215 [Coemansia reversa NRRL 1564]|eukprot:PIA16251.1 hypothetical protein COEREDRAFT_87215 [Coemansia reversa NRRL 1564]
MSTNPQEQFVKTLNPQTFELNGLDKAAESFYIPFFYFFENVFDDTNFMSTGLLKDSLFQVLREFPHLAGVLQNDESGALKIVVNPTNLNTPEFKETHSNKHFDEVKLADYSQYMLPKKANTTDAYLRGGPGKADKLVSINVIRFKDNSGVVMFISIAHVVMDATSYNWFVSRWAETCKHMFCGDAEAETPQRTLCNSRLELQKYIPAKNTPLGSIVDHSFIQGGARSKLISRLSHRSRAALFNFVIRASGTENHCYFITHQKLEEHREAAMLAASAKVKLSHNDIVMALIGIAVSQSLEPKKPKNALSKAIHLIKRKVVNVLFPKPTEFELGMAVDIRPRFDGIRTMGYCGGGAVEQRTLIPRNRMEGTVTANMVSKIASNVRLMTNSVDERYVASYIRAIVAEPDAMFRPLIYGAPPPAKMIVSNHTRLGQYQVDFGWGVPRWVSPLDLTAPNLCFVLPAPPPQDGIMVHIAMPGKIHMRMQKQTFWAEAARLIH